MFEGKTDQEGVMVAEPTVECLAQRGEFLAQPSFGQLGEALGVALSCDERVEHGPARNPQDIGGHRVELDASVFEGLVDPLRFRGVGLDEPLAIPSQIT